MAGAVLRIGGLFGVLIIFQLSIFVAHVFADDYAFEDCQNKCYLDNVGIDPFSDDGDYWTFGRPYKEREPDGMIDEPSDGEAEDVSYTERQDRTDHCDPYNRTIIVMDCSSWVQVKGLMNTVISNYQRAFVANFRNYTINLQFYDELSMDHYQLVETFRSNNSATAEIDPVKVDPCAVAVIGGSSSINAKFLDRVSQDTVYVSAVASDAEFSMDRSFNNTKYFRDIGQSFFRMHATDFDQCRAVAAFMAALNVKTFVVVSSKTVYGRHGTLSCSQQLARVGIQCTHNIWVQDTDESVMQGVRELYTEGARTILLHSEGGTAMRFMRVARTKGLVRTGFRWILTDDGATELYKSGIFENDEYANTPNVIYTITSEAGQGSLHGDPVTGLGDASLTLYQQRYVDALLFVLQLFKAALDTSTRDEPFFFVGGLAKVNHTYLGVAQDYRFNYDGGPASAEYNIGPFAGTSNRGDSRANATAQYWKFTNNELEFYGTQKDLDDFSLSGFQDYVPIIPDDYVVRVIVVLQDPFATIIPNSGAGRPSEADYDYFVDPSEGVIQVQHYGLDNPMAPSTDVTADAFKGTAIDILYELGPFDLSFNATVVYGKETCTAPHDCTWNGAIGAVVNDEADIAIGGISNSASRRKVVRFTVPFDQSSLAIMVHTPRNIEQEDQQRWAFVAPFSGSLWLSIGVSLLAVAVTMTLVDRLSPYGHHGTYFQQKNMPHLPQLEESAAQLEERIRDEAKEAMCIGNSFFWAWCGLCWQSPETVPRSPSARIIAVVWYMTGVILITSYTANLVSFLTHSHRSRRTIESFEALSNHLNDYTVGTIRDTVVEQFLEEHYPAIHSHVQMKKQNHKTLYDLYAAALNSNKRYAVIWDASALDRHIHEFTPNETVGRLVIPLASRISNSEYAFAVSKNSKIGDALLDAMHRFVSSDYGRLRAILGNGTQERMSNSIGETEKESLSRNHLGGVFRILMFLPVVCFGVLILEWGGACVLDIDKTCPNAPHTVQEAFSIRRTRLWLEFIDCDKGFGYYLYKCMPGVMSQSEFRSRMNLLESEKLQASRRKKHHVIGVVDDGRRRSSLLANETSRVSRNTKAAGSHLIACSSSLVEIAERGDLPDAPRRKRARRTATYSRESAPKLTDSESSLSKSRKSMFTRKTKMRKIDRFNNTLASINTAQKNIHIQKSGLRGAHLKKLEKVAKRQNPLLQQLSQNSDISDRCKEPIDGGVYKYNPEFYRPDMISSSDADLSASVRSSIMSTTPAKSQIFDLKRQRSVSFWTGRDVDGDGQGTPRSRLPHQKRAQSPTPFQIRASVPAFRHADGFDNSGSETASITADEEFDDYNVTELIRPRRFDRRYNSDSDLFSIRKYTDRDFWEI